MFWRGRREEEEGAVEEEGEEGEAMEVEDKEEEEEAVEVEDEEERRGRGVFFFQLLNLPGPNAVLGFFHFFPSVGSNSRRWRWAVYWSTLGMVCTTYFISFWVVR